MLALFALTVALSSPHAGSTPSDSKTAQYRGPIQDLVAIGSTPSPTGTPGIPPTANPGSPLLDPVGFLEGYNRWEFWFEVNKDLLLRSRDFRRREILTVLPPTVDPIPDQGLVRAEDARTTIARALRKAVGSTDPRVVRYAALGLGRIGARESLPILEDLIETGELETKRFATIAMGLIDDRAVLSRLIALLHDEEQVSPEVRAAAALGIGLNGRREGARVLRQYLEKHLRTDTVDGVDENVFLAAVLALGMCRDRDSTPYLITTFKTLRVDRASRSRPMETLLLQALGRIGDPSALIPLLQSLEEKNIEIRRAAAQALGDLGDRAAVAPLSASLAEDNDEQTRGFAAISLGRLGGQEARDALRAALQVKGSRTVKSFAALGLGLLGDRGSSAELLKILALNSEDNVRGSAAIALGLLGEPAAVEPLFELVKARGTKADFRGYCAIALGLIRPEGSLEKLLTILKDDPDKVDLWRRGLCLAIGLHRSAAAAPALAEVLIGDSRDVVREHAALALNLSRGRAAIDTLEKALEKDSRGDLALFSVIALSGMGDRFDYPLISESFFNVNYRLPYAFLESLLYML